jgi:biotin carboxylase
VALSQTRPRILLLLPVTTYRAAAFLDAAERLGVEVVVGADRCRRLNENRQQDVLALELHEPAEAAAAIVEAAGARRFDAIVPVDDHATLVAARAARALGLAHNSLESVEASRNKLVMRQRLAEAGVASPGFRVLGLDEEPDAAAAEIAYPCVLKPLLLSGSRGVIRADGPAELCAAFRRIRSLLSRPDVALGAGDAGRLVLIEDYVPGVEVALECLLAGGRLHVLALFDKPDPLEGPYFEETLYVTPSRLPRSVQEALCERARQAAAALGLQQGPVHAELRWNERGAWVIEVAARSIGGHCSRSLRFGAGETLEELILRHTLGLPLPSLEHERGASGVLMIPIPAGGMLRAVGGVEAARAVPLVEEIEITARLGERIVPLPEGASYLGFVFARAQTPEAVERALREAQARLCIDVEPELPMAW